MNKTFLRRGLDSSNLDMSGDCLLQLNSPITTKCPSTYLSQLATCNHHGDQIHLKWLAGRSRPCIYQGCLYIRTSIFPDNRSIVRTTISACLFGPFKQLDAGNLPPRTLDLNPYVHIINGTHPRYIIIHFGDDYVHTVLPQTQSEPTLPVSQEAVLDRGLFLFLKSWSRLVCRISVFSRALHIDKRPIIIAHSSHSPIYRPCDVVDDTLMY